MNFFALLGLSASSLRHHKSRSVLTALGIVIGVTTVIAILSLLEGLNRTIDEQFSALGTKTIYVQKMELNFGSGPGRLDFDKIAKRPDLTIEDAEAIENLESIRAAVATMERDVGTLTHNGNEVEQVSLKGSGEGGDLTASLILGRGRFINENDQKYRRTVCVIGSYISTYLFPDDDPIGQMLDVDGHKYQVVGVLEEKGAMFGRSQDIVPINTMQKYYDAPEGRSSIFGGLSIEVLPRDGISVDEALVGVEGLMRQRHGLHYYEDNDFGLNTQESMLSSLKQITSIAWLVMVGVAAISLIVGGIGIMNIMLVSVAERTREIGIRKAVGARTRDIMMQFLLEAVVLSLLGGAIGILAGLGIAGLVSLVTSLKAAAPWWTVVIGFAFSATVGILFGIYPAQKASKLNPIQAIRYE
jgi:putative ABC transport system permease protein